MKNKNIMYKILFLLVTLFIMNISCTDNFYDINTNKTQMMKVTDMELAGLFTNAQISGVCWLSSDQYGRGTTNWANPFSGYFTTAAASMEQMSLNIGHIKTVFTKFYSTSIPAIVAIQTNAKENNPAAYHIAAIWKAYVIYHIADVWGPVPYTNAGNGQAEVPYESVKDIYYSIFDDVTEAVNYLTVQVQSNPNLNVFGTGDIIYNGNVSKWIKFANTMRLRLAVRISNIDPEKAKTEAEAAVKGAMLESNDDNAWITNLPSFNGLQNGLARVSTWYNCMMTTNMESFLKGYDDPRLPKFFSPVEDQKIDGTPAEIQANVGGYNGLTPGYADSDYAYYRMYSMPGPLWFGKSVVTTTVPIHIKFAAETYFLKAEGAWRGWSMGGTAETFYNKGIELSVKQWRSDLTDTQVNAFINSTKTPVDPDNYPYYDKATTDIPVKFSTDKTRQYEQIITQKWLALYPDSWEAWAEYRRTRLPKLFPKKFSANTDVDVTRGQILTRLIYPDNEIASQPEEIAKAIELLGGPDKFSTPIWWDVNKNGN